MSPQETLEHPLFNGVPLCSGGHHSHGLSAAYPGTHTRTYTMTQEEPVTWRRGAGDCHWGSHGSPSGEPQTVGPTQRGSLTPTQTPPACRSSPELGARRPCTCGVSPWPTAASQACLASCAGRGPSCSHSHQIVAPGTLGNL